MKFVPTKKVKPVCGACGERRNLSWNYHIISSDISVPDGRHRIADMTPYVFLSCGTCSQTVIRVRLETFLHEITQETFD